MTALVNWRRLHNSTTSLSVCLSVRMKQLENQWLSSTKMCRNIPISVSIKKIKDNLPEDLCAYSEYNLRGGGMFRTEVEGETKHPFYAQHTSLQKSTIFWDITPCSPLKFNRRFG
jgi:hypothetical protein